MMTNVWDIGKANLTNSFSLPAAIQHIHRCIKYNSRSPQQCQKEHLCIASFAHSWISPRPTMWHIWDFCFNAETHYHSFHYKTFHCLVHRPHTYILSKLKQSLIVPISKSNSNKGIFGWLKTNVPFELSKLLGRHTYTILAKYNIIIAHHRCMSNSQWGVLCMQINWNNYHEYFPVTWGREDLWCSFLF